MASTTLLNDRNVLSTLGKIVNSLGGESSYHDDLMQEGLIHLWHSETERPGQTPSWYLQGCRFRLQHYLGQGRSVDSTKRRCGQLVISTDDEEATELFERLCTQDHEFSQLIVGDIVAAIAPALSVRERSVLFCLVDGLSSKEICERLGLSGPTVAKYRRRIARLAKKFEV